MSAGAPYEVRHGPFLVTTDRARFDLDVIHGFLRRSYWSPGVPRETVERAIAGSLRVRALRARPADRLRARHHGRRDLRVPGGRVRAGGAPRARPGRVPDGERDGAPGAAGAAPLHARDARRARPVPPLRLHAARRRPTASWSASRPTSTRARRARRERRRRPRAAGRVRGAPATRSRARARGPRQVRRVAQLVRPRRAAAAGRREHDAAEPDGGRALVRRAARVPRGGRQRSSAPARARSCWRARSAARRSRASACSTRSSSATPTAVRWTRSRRARRARARRHRVRRVHPRAALPRARTPASRCSRRATASPCSCVRDASGPRRSIPS